MKRNTSASRQRTPSAALSSPSSARPTPANRRSSTRSSVPRCRSSRTRCRRRAFRCAASPPRATASLSSSIRRACSPPRSASTRPWWKPPGAAPAMPTSSCSSSMRRRASTRRSRAFSRSSRTCACRASLVLNKIDRLASREKLLELAADLGQHLPFERVFMISATNGDGVADLKRNLAERVPPGPVALPCRRSHRRADAHAGGRDHAREDLPSPARRAALSLDGRDDGVDRAPRRLGAHRADDLTSPATARRRSCSARAGRRSSRCRWIPAAS